MSGSAQVACGGVSIAPLEGTGADAAPADAGVAAADAASSAARDGSTGGGRSDGATSGGASTDAGAGACNALANDAPAIVEVTSSGPMPSGEGGAIADGLYFATEARVYGGAAGAGPRTAMRVTGSTMEIRSTDSLVDLVVDATYVTQGVQLALDITCPTGAEPAPTSIVTYTASPSELTIFDTRKQRVLVFTRQ